MTRANEICRESKRQTINADDVLKAVEELDFTEFCEPLKESLAGASSRTLKHMSAYLLRIHFSLALFTGLFQKRVPPYELFEELCVEDFHVL